MKLIQPSFEIIEQEPGIEGMFKQIEKAARVCYRSEDKITDDSYKKMIKMLEDRGHYSPFAHGTVYLSVPFEYFNKFQSEFHKNKNIPNAWFHFNSPMWTKSKYQTEPGESWLYYTTNYRLIKELGLEKLLDEYWEEPNELSPKRVTVKVETSIAVSREWNRHATSLAICEQSTRYCAYNKEKFGGEITVVEPLWLKDVGPFDQSLYLSGLKNAETSYLDLLESGIKAQDARGVLPLDTATTVFYTGFVDDWKHIFEMRTSNAAHPEIRRIMIPLQEEFKKRGYID